MDTGDAMSLKPGADDALGFPYGPSSLADLALLLPPLAPDGPVAFQLNPLGRL
jgi:hypothetical protein